VVVVASGGDNLAALKGFQPRRQSGTYAERLVLDFGDDADEQAADETRSRLRCYRSQGWRITASPPALQSPHVLPHPISTLSGTKKPGG
jgi:hypothetical protein